MPVPATAVGPLCVPGPVAILNPGLSFVLDPVPMLRQMYGSAPTAWQKAMNSSVPNRFVSSACQASSIRRGLASFGPIPSVQW